MPDGAPKRALWIGGAVLGALSLAAAAAIGFFAGKSETRTGAPIAVVSASSGSVEPRLADAPRADAGVSLCVESAPPEGALAFQALAGAPTCEGGAAPKRGYLPLGAWLETDRASRVMLDVADIGHVEISPGTRLRILPGKGKEHRLELARGTLHARIDAPPRLFIVETGAGTAVDLGCAYTLEVADDGVGLLRVAKGEVALERAGVSVVVHRGEACEMRPGKGPGTPFPFDASAPFRAAVSAWDFDGAPIDPVLGAATTPDALGLLGLLDRASSPADRAKVVARLVRLVPPPASVSSEKLLAGDRDALAEYRVAIMAKR